MSLYLRKFAEMQKFSDNVSMKKKPTGVTHQINAKALALLARNPNGLRWSELLEKIKASDPTFHPKTVNGCVWKLVEKFPNQVYKPSKGVFRLKRFG